MALALTFAQPYLLPTGLPLPSLYVRVIRAEYRRQTAESEFKVGVLSYSVAYYLSAEALAAEADPLVSSALARHFVDYGEAYEAPATDKWPAHIAYRGITPAQANATPLLSQAYAHLQATLSAQLPGAAITQA